MKKIVLTLILFTVAAPASRAQEHITITDLSEPARASVLGNCTQADAAGNWLLNIESSLSCRVRISATGKGTALEDFVDCQPSMTLPPGQTGKLTKLTINVKNSCAISGVYISNYDTDITHIENLCNITAVLSKDRSRIDGIRECTQTVNGVQTQKARRHISFARQP